MTTKYLKKYVAHLMEYEAGWGSNIAITKYFDTEDERDTYVKNFNDKEIKDPNNTPSYHWYARAAGHEFMECESDA